MEYEQFESTFKTSNWNTVKIYKKNPFVCAQDGDQRTGYKPAIHVVNVQSIFLLTHTGHRAVVHLFPNDPQAALWARQQDPGFRRIAAAGQCVGLYAGPSQWVIVPDHHALFVRNVYHVILPTAIFNKIYERSFEFERNMPIKMWIGPRLLVFLTDPRDVEVT